jgi:hypothetical protein
MYLLTARSSWSDPEPVERVTFRDRDEALAWRTALLYPIVDVIDIGDAGRCPGRARAWEAPLGHRFAGQPEVCGDCRAPADMLYQPGTYIEREPDHR